MTPFERETSITTSDGDGMVRIWTAQRAYITRMKRNPAFILVDEGTYEGSPWADFRIPADQWNPATGAKRKRTMTDEQKAATAQRLKAARAAAHPTTPTQS